MVGALRGLRSSLPWPSAYHSAWPAATCGGSCGKEKTKPTLSTQSCRTCVNMIREDAKRYAVEGTLHVKV